MLFALIAAVTIAGQPAPPAEDEQEIVVSGTLNRQKQVHDFVKSLNGVPGTDPLARFDLQKTCPAAVGLTEALDAAITSRMRSVAKAAGIDLGTAGCAPNAIVIFAANKKDMIKALRRDRPGLFLDVGETAVEVPDEPGPATAWYLESRVDRNGTPISYNGKEGYYVVESSTTASRINAAARPVLRGSVVVIEQEAVIGLTTTQVADYAAMRALARLEPARLKKGAPPTILTALSTPMGQAAPNSLTQWDLGYLRGLYAARPDHSAQRQRASIGRQIGRQLDGTGEKAQGAAENETKAPAPRK